LHFPRIGQHHAQTPRFEQFKERNPIHAGRLHRHRGDSTVLQPVGQSVEIHRAGAKTAHGLRISVGWHRYPMLLRTDIYASRVPVARGQL